MSTNRRVVITGIGIMCNLGSNKEEVFDNLIKENIVFTETSDLEGIKVGKCNYPAIELETPYTLDRIELMACKTIDEAMEDSGLTVDEIRRVGHKAAFSFSTSLYGIDQWLKGLTDRENSGLYYLHSRQLISRIVERYKIKGSCYVTNSACASGTAGAIVGYDLIKNNEADIVLVGGTDSISTFTLYGFNSLQSLSKDICKPFDSGRDGINIGEGSSFFIFEELEHARQRGAKSYGEVVGYGLANEAYHMTSPDPEGHGALCVMQEALKQADITSQKIDYINAHGTGTMANDTMELKAIEELLGEDVNSNIYVSSTKSRTGHCLGAAGSIELAFSLFALNSNVHLHTLNSKTDIPNRLDILKSKDKSIDLNYVMSNSFAFAGNMASIIIKKVK